MNLQESISRLRINSDDGKAWDYLMKKMNGQIVYQISHRLKFLNMEKEDLKQEIGLFLLDRIILRPSLRNRNNNGIRKEIDINKSEQQIYNCLSFEINNFVLRKINKNKTRKETNISFRDENGKYYRDLNGRKITFKLNYDKDKQQFYFIDDNKHYVYLQLHILKDNVYTKNPITTDYIELTDKHESNSDEIKYDHFLYVNKLYTDENNIMKSLLTVLKNDNEMKEVLDYILQNDFKQGRNFVRSARRITKICNEKIKPLLRDNYGLGTNYKLGRKKQNTEESFYQFR